MIVKRAVVYTLASRQFSVVIMVAGTVVLARLLTPDDFGVFATAIAVISVAWSLVDFGLSAYIVQRAGLDRETVAAATGLSLSIAITVMGIIGVFLFVLPDAIIPPAMRPALGLLTLGVIIKPLIMPVQTSLYRDVRFGLISVLSTAQMAVQVAVSIILAQAGFGAAALAGGVLAETFFSGIMLTLMAGRGRLVVPSFRGWTPLFDFGFRYTTTVLLSRIGDLLVALSVMRLLGFALLGQLDRARTVVSLVDRSLLDGLLPVVLPAFSHLLRTGTDPAQLYVRKTAHLTALCWPVFAVIAVLAEPLVAVMLGPQWLASVPAVRILAMIGLFLPFERMSMQLFVALGRNRQFLRIQATHQALRVMLVAGGALISFEAACLGMSLGSAVKAALVTPALKAATGFSSKEIARMALRGAAITALSVVGPALLILLQAPLGNLSLLAAGIILAAFGWVAGSVLTHDPLLVEILQVIGLKTPAPRPSDARAL